MVYARGNVNSTVGAKEQPPAVRETGPHLEQERILRATEHGKQARTEAGDDGPAAKPLVLFGTDLSFLSPLLRYVVLACGMFFFMCLYGYFQELVVYGWFQRKLSIFSTFLHFLGSSVFAQMQYHYSPSGRAAAQAAAAARRTKDDDSPDVDPEAATTSSALAASSSAAAAAAPLSSSRALPAPPLSAVGPVALWRYCRTLGARTRLTMGTAPPRLALGYYLLLVLLKTATQGFTTACMAHINYPAKVLFKSANPVITMLIGLVWFRKSYPVRDYIVVALLVLGLYVFMNGDAKASPKGTGYGIFLVTLSMFGSAGVPMVQEHCMHKYNASIEELLYHCYLGSTGISFILALTSGELWQGMSFLVAGPNGSVWTWLSFAAFCTFGYCGANFGAALTMQFGSLVNGITNTARKAVTLALSFAMFPERNTLTSQHVVGASVFFCGLIVRTLMKDPPKAPQPPSQSPRHDRLLADAAADSPLLALHGSGAGSDGGGGYGYHLRHGSLALSHGDLTSLGVPTGGGPRANGSIYAQESEPFQNGGSSSSSSSRGGYATGSMVGTSAGCDSTDSHDGLGYPKAPTSFSNGHRMYSNGHGPHGSRDGPAAAPPSHHGHHVSPPAPGPAYSRRPPPLSPAPAPGGAGEAPSPLTVSSVLGRGEYAVGHVGAGGVYARPSAAAPRLLPVNTVV